MGSLDIIKILTTGSSAIGTEIVNLLTSLSGGTPPA
ncbi:hypothetical protein BH09ACT9_BH09ACT9_45150 [soil metagenome]|nr:hypothetical protein BKP42_49090 [Rhodococcus erythropolis]